jgi:hypothetical protein
MRTAPSLLLVLALACAAPPEPPSPESVLVAVTSRAPATEGEVTARRRVALLPFVDETQRGPAAFARGHGPTVQDRAAAVVEARLLASGLVELVAPGDADLVVEGFVTDLLLQESSRSDALSRTEAQSAAATLTLRVRAAERTVFDGTATGVATFHDESLRVLGPPDVPPPDTSLVDEAFERAVELMAEDLLGSIAVG